MIHSSEERGGDDLRAHLRDVLGPEVSGGGQEEQEVEEADDFAPYEIHVPDHAAEKDKRLHWNETKKALPCPEEFESALLHVLKEVSDAESKMSPAVKTEALKGILRLYSAVLVAAIRARA